MEGCKQWIIEKTKQVGTLVGQVEWKKEDFNLSEFRSYVQKNMKHFIDVCIPVQLNKEKRFIIIKDKKKNYEQFQCAICTLVFYNPVITICGHIFCEECITKVAKTFDKCPMCRKNMTKESIKQIPVKYLGDVYSNLSVRCPKCRYKTTIIEYKTHFNTCGINKGK